MLPLTFAVRSRSRYVPLLLELFWLQTDHTKGNCRCVFAGTIKGDYSVKALSVFVQSYSSMFQTIIKMLSQEFLGIYKRTVMCIHQNRVWTVNNTTLCIKVY